jgi:hypothetical protein
MKLFYCYGPPLIRERRRKWKGRVKSRREERKGWEKRMGGREELGRPEAATREKKSSSDFYRGSLLYCLKGWTPLVIRTVVRFVYEEFKVDEVKKVEKRSKCKTCRVIITREAGNDLGVRSSSFYRQSFTSTLMQ